MATTEGSVGQRTLRFSHSLGKCELKMLFKRVKQPCLPPPTTLSLDLVISLGSACGRASLLGQLGTMTPLFSEEKLSLVSELPGSWV